jgi:hypothetical protein
MNNRYSPQVFLMLVLGAVACAVTGCNSKAGGASHAITTIPGRTIEAHADGPVSVQNFGDRAAVSILSHELTIERERVLLDGAELAKLPAGATHIVLTTADGELTVTADGVPIARKQLSK